MNADILFFFDQKPAALPLYEAFEGAVLSQIEGVQIQAQKTQIAFSNRHRFAFVSFLPVRKAGKRPINYITVTLGLPRHLSSSRIDAAVEPYPGRWTHHILLTKPEEIDGQLMGWVKEAAAFSAGKR